MWFWFFIVSFSINILLLFYTRWMLRTLAAINVDTQNLTIIMSDFSNHLKTINELEMFYGDENLRSLIDHSKLVIENIESMDLILEDEGTELEETEKKEN